MSVYFEPAVLAPPVPLFHDRTLPSGVRLRYAEQGLETGPAVVMLHGLSDSSFSFSRVLPLLPATLRVIVPDLRGHGGSDRPGVYTMDAFASDVLELMDALAIPSATIVGHSMGSFVARRLALKAPSRVTRLVLVGAGANARNEALIELRQAVDALRDPVAHEFVRDFQLSTVYADVPPGFLAYAISESERVPAAVWQGALGGMMDHEPAEHRITAPTLILGGNRDTVFSEAEQYELARRIPGADIHIFPGLGHAPTWEDPDAFVRKLLTVLPV